MKTAQPRSPPLLTLSIFFSKPLQREWPRLPFTARIGRAHSDRARSASKKGTWPLPPPLTTAPAGQLQPLLLIITNRRPQSSRRTSTGHHHHFAAGERALQDHIAIPLHH